MLKRALKSLVAVVLIVSFMTTTAAFYYFWVAATPTFNPPRMVSIKKGDSVRAITEKLRAAGVVRNAVVARVYAGLSGAAPRMQPGDYAFKGGERVPDVIKHLAHGDFIVVTVIVPEGLTVYQIAGKIQQAGLGCAIDFERAARDGPLVTALGLTPLGAEGYLFPATYNLAHHTTAADLTTSMVHKFREAVQTIAPDRLDPLTPGTPLLSVVTLASIVESETPKPDERPLVAGVYTNRLHNHMLLQCDPTIVYALKQADLYNPPLTYKDLHYDSPYNTYQHAGLPPGPIGNPGETSLRAAFAPAQTDYLYFVANNQGGHFFASTLAQHNQNVAKYHRLLNGEPADPPAAEVKPQPVKHHHTTSAKKKASTKKKASAKQGKK